MREVRLNKNFSKTFLYCYMLYAICYMLNGCATVPKREEFPAYTINGTDYYSLVTLCETKGINYAYDEFTRIITLTGNTHRIAARVGDGLAIVDGEPVKFSAPVDIYQGMIVVPYKFKEEILDRLFKDILPGAKAGLPISKIKKIVIDPGHGGRDPGAIGKSGLKEKDINLDIAKRLHNLLTGDGVEVIMTRSDDAYVPLSERVQIANNAAADLFISIHSNANRVKSMNGFEVYYIAPNIGDSSRAYFSARKEGLNIDEGCFADSSTGLKAIVWDMLYTHSRAEAIELSRSICRSAQDNLGVEVLGVKKGRYLVLKDVFIPTVLIEAGFLSNSKEERMLNNAYYRQKIAESIAGGIRDYGQTAVLMEAKAR